MNPTSSFILILLVFLCSHQILAADTADSSDLITKTCEETLYKDLCKASLQSAVYKKQVDLHDLALFALKLALTNASDISNYINNLLSATTDSFMRQCLTDCAENYVDAIDQIEDSIGALESKGYDDVNMWVTAAMSDAESCEEGFSDKQGQKSPLTDRNTLFSQLGSNALAIVNLLSGM